jgi:hypothetical protein
VWNPVFFLEDGVLKLNEDRPMANATVEKLKALGLRHGEKAAVTLAGVLCILFVGMAFSHPTIQLTPDQLKKSADAATQNINKPQRVEDILAKLDEANLKDPGFEKKVEDNKPGVIDSSKFALGGASWVSPEPGAGLIRDTPELIAPTELYATANRGAVLMFERDEANGDIVYEEPKDESDISKQVGVRKKRAKRAGGGGSRGGSSMPGMGGRTKRKKREKSELQIAMEKQAEAKKANERLQGELVGNTPAGDDEAKAKEEADAKAGKMKPKEVLQGYRCVALVGRLDHQKLKDNYVRALKDPNAAPHYRRLDLQRQELDEEGNWTDWTLVDYTSNARVFDDITERENELTPEDVRLPGLVDKLPFLKAGYWRGVHLADMVPREKRTVKIPELPKNKGRTGGRNSMQGMMGGSASDMMKSMGRGMMQGAGGYGQGYGGSGGGGSGGMMDADMAGSRGMRGAGLGGGGGGPRGGPADREFARSEAETVMIRSLDFTVDDDTTYRYRVRIVVRNPNLGWETVAPGVDVKSEELTGPWSVPTGPVSIPADVSTYALHLAPGTKTGEEVTFQVVSWSPDDGVTVVNNFEAAPGQIIGSPRRATVPNEDTKGTKSVTIDFTSRQVLLQAQGGARALDVLGEPRRLDVPADALVLRNDGTLVLRDQAFDRHNPEMRQLKQIYDQAVAEAKAGKEKKKTAAAGPAGYGGGMGSGGGGVSDQ